METIRQLRHLVALADHRHFGRAALAANITQAALTQSVQKVEELHGVPLFERRYGDVSPTAYGDIVIATARAVLSRIENTHRQVRLMQKLAAGRLIVGCDSYFSETVVTPGLIRLLNQFPHLEFTLETGGWETMQERLLASEIDLYVGFPYEATDSRLATENHELPPMIVFCRSGHPLDGMGPISPADAFQYPTVGPKPSQWLSRRLIELYSEIAERHANDTDRRLPAYLLTTDFSVVRRVVGQSDALAATLPRAFAQELATRKFVRLPILEFNFPIPLVIASVARQSLSPAARALLAEIRTEIDSIIAAPNRAPD